MYGTATVQRSSIRYGDHGSHAWIWKEAPCNWDGNVEVQFVDVALRELEPAGSWTNPAIVSRWLRRMKAGRAVPPIVVCATERGSLYIRDGNHRFEALRDLFAGNLESRVRVARVVPKPGYQFRYRWLGNYGTYLLEPVSVRTPLRKSARSNRLEVAPRLGQTLLLMAHPDDETGGCAGLLQRLCDPVVLFATDGVPADKFFWQRFGSPQEYGRVRRREAAAALAAAGVHRVEFVTTSAGGGSFCDQQLYRALPELFHGVEEMIRRYSPQAIIVPAYEGGHPDHDACSFIGWLVRRRLNLPVWEVPLYHRSSAGVLVCQEFLEWRGTEMMFTLTPTELQTRASMVACYGSQCDLADYVTASVQYLRPQYDYDYSQPPHDGILNYEAWQWPISPSDVCHKFQECACDLGLQESCWSSAALVPATLTASATAGSLQ